MEKNKNFYCIIMAGGAGSRFWPISRNALPKQFLDILGIGRTFLQMTVERFEKLIPTENIIIVTSRRYKDLVAEQVPQVLPENVLLEPYKRNTAPCIAYATYKLRAKNPDAVVVVAPSDHLIIGEDLFLETVASAMACAQDKDALFTLGIRPTTPNINYGYIQANKSKSIMANGHSAYKVKTFTEKPDAEMAKLFIETGEFSWNAGIFIWSLRDICAELEHHIPEIASLFSSIEGDYNTAREQEAVDAVYAASPSISIDYALMEKTSSAWVIQTNFGWSDIGTWASIYDLSPHKDSLGNVIGAGQTLCSDLEGCLVKEQNQEKLVVVKGLKNYMVIDTGDVLMVAPRDDGAIKQILMELAVEDKAKYM
mgnify:FL=1